MRRLTVLLLVAFSVSLRAQTVDEIIAKNIAARGGLAKLKAIQSMRITGDFETSGMKAGFTQVYKRPMKVRTDISIQGMTMTQACDGQNGWQIVPFTGAKDPLPMKSDELKRIQEEADFDGPLLDYKQKGNTVELAGNEKVDGKDAYHLKITLKNGDVHNLFLDKDSFLAIKSAAKARVQGTEIETESTIGGYKDVHGVMFPFSIEQHAVGTQGSSHITLRNIELNVPIDDSTFKMPAVTPPPGGEQPKKPASGSTLPQL